jgi:glucose-6-phosphate 1-dehydrogenase
MAVTDPGNSASGMAPPSLMVIIGGTGDPTRRKRFSALHHLWKEKTGPERFAVVDVGRDKLTGAPCRNRLNGATREHYGEGFDESVRVEMTRRFFHKASL